MASPTAIRAAAAEFNRASGARSPMAKASLAIAAKVYKGDRAVSEWQLPWANHLFTCGETTDAAVTDGHQEVLGRHSGVGEDT